MPNGQPRRSVDATRARELFGFEATHAAARRARAHGRLVPRARRRLPLRRESQTARRAGRASTARSTVPPRWRVASAVRPVYVLGALLGVQWIAVLALALTVRHNGWLYYAGGDQLWHYSGAVPAGARTPAAGRFVGYGWSILLLPVAAFAGPNLVSALPAIVLFNTLVLLPVALLCVYGIGARIAGRSSATLRPRSGSRFPYLGILFVQPGYHQKYTELTLPQALGLSSVPTSRPRSALIVSAYLCLRAVEGASWHAVRRRAWQPGTRSRSSRRTRSSSSRRPCCSSPCAGAQALPFAAGLAPALLTLALWKYRGLGELAARRAEPIRLAVGVGDLLDRVHRPELNSFAPPSSGRSLGFREHFWVGTRDRVAAARRTDRRCSLGRCADSCSSATGSSRTCSSKGRTFSRRSKTRASSAS